MTTAIDLGLLILALALAFGAPVLLNLWTRAAADWFWMLAIRGWLVGGISFAVLLVVTGAMRLAFGMHFISPLAILAGLLATPLAAVPLANLVARHRTPPAERPEGARLGDFIYRQRRREQSEAYSAPSADI